MTYGKFVGPVTIQFIKEFSTNIIYIIEINPRFGGGVLNSIEAGADAPSYILHEYLGCTLTPINKYKNKLLMMRADREFFQCK